MKKIPMRKCVATNEQLPKRDLIRVVRSKEGELFVDATEAIELAKKKGALKRALEVDIPDEIYEELMTYAVE